MRRPVHAHGHNTRLVHIGLTRQEQRNSEAQAAGGWLCIKCDVYNWRHKKRCFKCGKQKCRVTAAVEA